MSNKYQMYSDDNLIGSYYHKSLVHQTCSTFMGIFPIFDQFINFINFGLIENDLCHSQSRHAFYHHIYFAQCIIYHLSSLKASSYLKLLLL